MNIKEITITGFKGYAESVSYNFYDNTVIEGRNKLGKTSIGEAIIWCLYGCNLLGNDKSDNDLMNQTSDSMEVKLSFIYKETECILVRKKSKSLSIKLNNQKVSQKELLSFLPGKDLFLAIFNTITFISQAPNKCRTQFMTMLPKIEVTDVINDCNRWDIFDTVNKYSDINEGISMLSTKIRELEDKILKSEGEEASLNHLLVEILASEFPEDVIFSGDDELSLSELKSKIEQINKSELIIDTNSIELQIKDIKEEILKEDNKSFIPEEDEIINSMRSEIATCKGQIMVLNKTLNSISSTDGHCAACGQQVTEEHKNTEINRLTNDINSLEDTIISYESTMQMFQEINIEKFNTFNKNKTTVLNGLRNDLTKATKYLSDIRDKYKFDLSHFEENKQNEISSIKKELKFYEEKKHNFIMLNNQKKYIIETKSNYESKLNYVISNRAEMNKTIGTMNREKSLLAEYNTFYVEYLNKVISTYFENVTIDLFKVSKSTGEISDTFRINYEGKRYSLLSNAERVLVSLELSNMFNKVLGVKLPVFIDNGESILDIPKLDTQMIIAKVLPCEITVYPSNIVNDNEVELIDDISNNDNLVEYDTEDNGSGQMSFV